LIEISEAGSYYAAIATSSAAPAAPFTLRIGFAPGLNAGVVEVAGSPSSLVHPPAEPTGDEPIELVLDPGGNYIYPPMFMRFSVSTKNGVLGKSVPGAKGDEPIELVLDPGGNYVYTPLTMRFSIATAPNFDDRGSKTSPLGTSYTVRYAPVAVCPVVEHDDHGDTLACATELSMGGRLGAEIAGDLEEDRDTFAFTLKQRTTVKLAASGEIAAEGVLLDAAGLPISRVTSERGDGFRIETSLEPGRYYLRVGAQTGEQGAYELQLGSENDNL
jgi:hypothetical protein